MTDFNSMVFSSGRAISCKLGFGRMLRGRYASFAAAFGNVLGRPPPRAPRRIAAREPDAARDANGERCRAKPAGDERIGAEILDRSDFGARTAFETERDVLRAHAERETRAFGGRDRRTVCTRNN